MRSFKRKNLYGFYSDTELIRTRLFWIGATLATAFLISYLYFVYLSIDLSYKIEETLRLSRIDTVAHQQIEERYIAKLETLRAEGAQTLALTPPKSQFFVERHSAVSRVAQ